MRTFKFVIAASALVFAACAPAADDDTPEGEAPPASEATPPAAPAAPQPVMTAEMQPASGSQVTGKVDIMPSTDPATAFRVSLTLNNVPAGEHAWHIHRGACGGKDMPVVVPFTEDKDKPALASPLIAAADGLVSADVAVPANLLTIDQLRSGDYALAVHEKGGIDHGPTIVCATL